MRNIRKVTTYLCTRCFRTFPDGARARAHLKEVHAREATRAGAKPKEGRRITQTGRVLSAIEGGAKTAKEVGRRTRLPLPRVHSLLTYLRKRGKVSGYAKDLRAR
ncbi:MAG: hypothetical protein ACYDCK_03905 [Thermoplasmatota archaeon]